eukprot:15455971-Alexandrium_andersonii.AAC.1
MGEAMYKQNRSCMLPELGACSDTPPGLRGGNPCSTCRKGTQDMGADRTSGRGDEAHRGLLLKSALGQRAE